MRMLPRVSDLRRMKRPDQVATLNACAQHHRKEIGRLEAADRRKPMQAHRTLIERHRCGLGKVLLQAHLARINVGGSA